LKEVKFTGEAKMAKNTRSQNLGVTLIIGGIVLTIITLGGYYINNNPDKLFSLFKKSSVNLEVLHQVLKASDTCVDVAPVIFSQFCAKKNSDPVALWTLGLGANAKTCIDKGFTDITMLEMSYRREPEENFKVDYDFDYARVYFACSVFEDMKREFPEREFSNSKRMLDTWFETTLFQMRDVNDLN